MIKARNKKLSMLLVLAMLMTMFVGVGTASAAGTEYITLTAPTISTDSDAYKQLGKVSIDIADVRTVPEGGEWLTISLPSGAEFDPDGGANYDDTAVDTREVAGLSISASDNLGILAMKISSKNSMEVKVAKAAELDGRDGDLLLDFQSIKVKSGSGNVDATFLAPGDGTFPMGTATIAKIGGGATTVMAKSVKTFGDSGGEIDTIIIAENRAGVLDKNETIELRLPKGFTWDNSGVVVGAWGMAGKTYTATIKDGSSNRILVVEISDKVSTTSAGRVNIGVSGDFFEINVEDTAKLGDIYVTVTSSEDSVDKTELLVAKYGDYGVKVEAGTTEEVLSGREKQELGKFYIEEQIEGSLIAGRSLYFELPKGVKWQYDGDDPVITMKSEEGTGIENVEFSKVANTGDRKIRASFDFTSEDGNFSDEAIKLVVKSMEVRVQPSFEGEIAVTVSGNSGAEGEVVVAEAIKPVSVKAEGTTKVEIGAMNQQASDILITENVDEAILDDQYYREILITLPRGVVFASEPTVEVEEGDLEIDSVDYDDNELLITIETASSKKSIVRISEVFLTVDRTVPEGDVQATFVGKDFDEAFVNWDTDESIGDVVVATTITPSEGGYAKFIIGSNIYQIGAVPYVMDAVPYIKASRSYVPMRYLAEMLGAEVTWEQAEQTVTMTNGETTVVFTIGSTTYTVNGEAMTADVAPEIVNDRSFLPARFVAEAFGAQVGWDEGLQTVLIQR